MVDLLSLVYDSCEGGRSTERGTELVANNRCDWEMLWTIFPGTVAYPRFLCKIVYSFPRSEHCAVLLCSSLRTRQHQSTDNQRCCTPRSTRWANPVLGLGFYPLCYRCHRFMLAVSPKALLPKVEFMLDLCFAISKYICSIMLVISDKDAIFDRTQTHRSLYAWYACRMQYVCNIYGVQLIAV